MLERQHGLQPAVPDGVDLEVQIGEEVPAPQVRDIDPEGIDIYWAAYLGTPDEILVSGPLSEVREEILSRHQEAASRKGWIFDTYLLRRR